MKRKFIKYKSGAKKESWENRGRFDLIPPKALERIALRCELGAKKYGPRNWEKGIPKEIFINSAFRHLIQYMQNLTDEDHLAAAAWNLMAIMELESKDMPKTKNRKG